MEKKCTSVPLADLGALRVRGPDVVPFLQGQLSNDVALLTPEHSVFAGYHNPQGRVIGLLRLLQLEHNDLLAILPRELGPVVAQMLNLDVLGAIAFDKGCYTGQEVIARAHYRGRVKRRLQRFASRGPLRLRPSDSGQLSDGRAFKVVEAVQLADGRCEFLA